MSRRFLTNCPLTAGVIRLEGAEAHHLAHVMRLTIGEMVTLFDGQDLEAQATITGIAGGKVDLAIQELRGAQCETVFPLILAAAVPKGDRFAWLIEKATELGVQRFIPLITERSVVDPGEAKLDKMRRTIVEASKQCGRTRLMELATPLPWTAFVNSEFAAAQAWVAHPGGAPIETRTFAVDGPIVVAIGPEGGFTDAELDRAAKAGANLLSLGPRVLRIETAALALAARITTCR
jgi:16S rRNA (uracil1498-N3)-methyltransferase